MSKRTKARAEEAGQTTTEKVESANVRRGVGTDAGDAALRTILDGARELWRGGSLQKAGREIVLGRKGIGSSVRALAAPARDLLDRAVQEHGRVAQEERSAERQLVEATRERRQETKARIMKRGGKTETVMRGVISDPDQKPVAGLTVEGRRAVADGVEVLAVDVTDSSGRYQLVIPNDTLGDADTAELSLEIGLDRAAVLHRPGSTFEISTGTATNHDLVLPDEAAGQAHHALADRDDVDVQRIRAHYRRSALLGLQEQQLASLAAGLGRLLGATPDK